MSHPKNTEIFSFMFLTTTISFAKVSAGFNLVCVTYQVSKRRKIYEQKLFVS